MAPATASAWVDPGIVAGFATAPPNPHVIDYARRQCRGYPSLAVLDIGCGAGRNAVPLALSGANVIGTDLSLPMLRAARDRSDCSRLQLAQSPMHALPVRDRSIDLIIAHGIWNLARSGAEFRRAVAEAARVAAPGAALFVFTFSRTTLARNATPIAGETFVFTQFSGQPQVFLTCEQLLLELHTAGFDPDPALPFRELNVPPPGRARVGGAPVIFEAAFRRTGD
jgi:SAM-dependent methyltransferase